MCIEMCIELILELAGFALLLALCDVVLFPSPLQFIFAVILPHFVVNKKHLRNAILL